MHRPDDPGASVRAPHRGDERGSLMIVLSFGVLILAVVSVFLVNAALTIAEARTSGRSADYSAGRESAFEAGLGALNGRNSGACDLSPTSRSSAGAPTTPVVLNSPASSASTTWTVRALQLSDRCVLLATVRFVDDSNPTEDTTARLNACPIETRGTSSTADDVVGDGTRSYSRATLGLGDEATWRSITCTEVDTDIYGSYELTDTDGDGVGDTPKYYERRAPQPTVDASGAIVNDVGDSSYYIWYLR